jgi:hypothetical protein
MARHKPSVGLPQSIESDVWVRKCSCHRINAMVTLRCTQKLLVRASESKSPVECPDSTTALGDWYCNLVRFGRSQVVICVSEFSYLMIMLPASPSKTIGKRLCERLEVLLQRLAIPSDQIQAELGQMQIQCCTKTSNRVKVGVMNSITQDLLFTAEGEVNEFFLSDCELQIADGLYGGPKYKRPGPETKQLLLARWGQK